MSLQSLIDFLKPRRSFREKLRHWRRAAMFASGHIRMGDWSGVDRSGLSYGWEKGYEAALRDVRKELNSYDRSHMK